MFKIVDVDCGNTGTMLSTREGTQPAPAANMATAFQNSLSKATSQSCFDFEEFYADFLRLFGAFSSSSVMHFATKFRGMYIIGGGTPLRTASDN